MKPRQSPLVLLGSGPTPKPFPHPQQPTNLDREVTQLGEGSPAFSMVRLGVPPTVTQRPLHPPGDLHSILLGEALLCVAICWALELPGAEGAGRLRATGSTWGLSRKAGA